MCSSVWATESVWLTICLSQTRMSNMSLTAIWTTERMIDYCAIIAYYMYVQHAMDADMRVDDDTKNFNNKSPR